jgi:hypothetical protein
MDRAIPEGDDPSFSDEFIKIFYFLDSSIQIPIFKQVLKYIATGLQRSSGTNSPPAEASTQGLKYRC